MSVTPNLGLTLWDQDDDPYNHTQLAINFTTLDAHDHTLGRGKRIVTAAIQDAAITTLKLTDLGTTTAKLANLSVTNAKLADESVDGRVIKPASVDTEALADRSVTSPKLSDDIVPVGTIISWWRPSIATPLPGGWLPADGRTLIAADHEFAGGGTIQLPDLRNKFILGAALGGTGVGPTVPPALGQSGGTNSTNLGHTHSVSHSHGVNSHTHGMAPHDHVVNPHSHNLNTHSHTVDAHTHTVGGHTHSVTSHTHSMGHAHSVAQHAHGIHPHGFHNHGIYSRLTRTLSQDGAGTSYLQTLYIAGFNSGGENAYHPGDGGHDHYGATQYNNSYTDSLDTGSTGSASPTAVANSSFNTATTAPGTNTAAGVTQSTSPGTSATSGTTGGSSGTTTTETPTSGTGLSTTDIRPSYVGLLQLIKVKH